MSYFAGLESVLTIVQCQDAEKPETIIQARYAILAELPLPPDVPSDILVPIIIPPPFTIHDFLGTAVGVSRDYMRLCLSLTVLTTTSRSKHSKVFILPCNPSLTVILCRLTNYRVFQESTTSWCPEREEHGYYITPFYKCNTNPKMIAAHRWTAVDLAARVNRPTGTAALAPMTRGIGI